MVGIRSCVCDDDTTGWGGQSTSGIVDSQCEFSKALYIVQKCGDHLSEEVATLKAWQQQMLSEQRSLLNRQRTMLDRLERLPSNLDPSSSHREIFEHGQSYSDKREDNELLLTDSHTRCHAHRGSKLCGATGDEGPESEVSSLSLKTDALRADPVHTLKVNRTSEQAQKDEAFFQAQMSVKIHEQKELALMAREEARFWKCSNVCKLIVDHYSYKCLSTCAVLLNVAYLGYVAEVDLQSAFGGGAAATESRSAIRVIRIVFMIVFFLELMLNLIADNQNVLTSQNRCWHAFDFSVTCLDVIEFVFSRWLNAGDSVKRMQNISILRLMRGLKVLRVFRMVKAFAHARGIRLLLLAIMASVKQLAWAMCLLISIIYLFSILFMTGISSYLEDRPMGKAEATSPELMQYWGSLWKTILTLFQSISGGVSWIEPCRPLATVGQGMEFLFLLYLSFAIFAVLNVVTGVFCNSAIETAQLDTDMVISCLVEKQKRYINDTRYLFHLLDTTASGSINFHELESQIHNPQISAYLTHLQIETDDAWHFFRMLDDDKSHRIDADEWTRGCLRLRGHAQNYDIKFMEKEHKKIVQMLSTVITMLHGELDTRPMNNSKVNNSKQFQIL
eukprot:TRINITY_DN37946_c0_g1_i1.p1 TRINITY_DN37946_c0_g1~~TRINITY_DN37946_c0_g1_i1.p1  ORF type:complete len:617 (+),score=81.49 TRINITY_DN37946_c0_g1_i1:128-1978(+)